MRQSPRLGNCLVALCQCLVGKAGTKEDDRQSRLCCQLRVDSGLTHERVMGVRIVKRENRLEVRSGRGKADEARPSARVPKTAELLYRERIGRRTAGDHRNLYFRRKSQIFGEDAASGAA